MYNQWPTLVCATNVKWQLYVVAHPPFDVPVHHDPPRPSMEVLQSPSHITGHLHPDGRGQGGGVCKMCIQGAPGHEGVEKTGPGSVTAATQQWQQALMGQAERGRG